MATDARTIRGYNEHAEEYARHAAEHPYHRDYIDPAMREALGSVAMLDVLDIGCADGRRADELIRANANRVEGIDIASGLIALATHTYTDPRLRFRVADMENLPFGDESFDVVTSTLVIHYARDWSRSLSEARRVLRPGGRCVFSCAHPIDTGTEVVEGRDGSVSRLIGSTVLPDQVRIPHGNYLATRQVTMRFAGIEAHFYHKSIEAMIGEIVASGFSIESAVGAQPTEAFSEFDTALYEQYMNKPAFLIWSLTKNTGPTTQP